MGLSEARSVVQSVGKAFAVLKAFDSAFPELTASQVAERASLDRGTAFRLIKTMVELGYMRGVPGSKRYRLTLKCLELGFNALSSSDLSTHAEPLLREAVPDFADAGSLGVLERGEVVYLQRVQTGLDRHGFDRRPGSRTGAYAAALGHAILAYLPREEQVANLESIERVKVSERTLTALPDLLSRLQTVRGQGYAVSDGENAYGLRTVAAPILSPDSRPLAAVSLTVQSSRMPLPAFTDAAVPVVRRIASELADGVRLSRGAIGVGRTL
ncbi:MAG: IclR family transcriptional regulator [Methylobacteriaceae bacterium]|nr:IclR family transcriptional regulator [Methylobacteriaceae bacterium]